MSLATLDLLKALARCRSVDEVAALVRTFAFERLLKLPVVFTDRNDLRFVLYPGQNAQAYFQNEGNYEVGETRFFESWLRPGMTLIDVGANIGMYTLLGAKLVGAGGQVHAFEPESRNFERLVANLALNGFSAVRVNRKAVFSESRVLTLNVFPDSLNAWHSLGNPTLPDPFHHGRMVSAQATEQVPGISLDDHCAATAVSHVDLLKIDVEGAEVDVLEGARRLFAERRVDAIMFEISLPQIQAMGHRPEQIFSLLARSGFSIFTLDVEGRLLPSEGIARASYQNLVALREPESARRLLAA